MQLRETKFTDSKLRSKKKKGEDEHQNYTAKDMATSTLPEVAIRDSNDQSSKVEEEGRSFVLRYQLQPNVRTTVFANNQGHSQNEQKARPSSQAPKQKRLDYQIRNIIVKAKEL
uniref:Uncharacterized protein n=1 Tax=Cucumis melo TaxID=3656 RepID=A0A9I9EGV0_CUCME